MDIDVVLVLYNKSVSSLGCLEKLESTQCVKSVIICDNSTHKNNNEELSRKHSKIIYIDMGGNKGLSKAYNHALDRINAEYVCFLDDDTKIPDDFFDKVSEAIRGSEDEGKYQILLPMVYSPSCLLSPCQKNKGSFSSLEPPYDFDKVVGLSAINSCMIVRSDIYDNYRYDTDLFLDNIDHDFMDYVRANGVSTMILQDVICHQSFSRDMRDADAEKKRFKIWVKDNKHYYAKGGMGSRLYGIREEFRRRLYLFKKYNDFSFWWL